MKPKRIILIRHGESEANIDNYDFAEHPDYTIELTEKGKQQSREAGLKLRELIGDEDLYFYISPYWRSRTAFEEIAKAFPPDQIHYNEDPRLREQEWGHPKNNEEFRKVRQEQKEYGKFYYRFPGGEAGSDVYDRINDFLGSLHRDFHDPSFPDNCILITHSMVIRMFVTRFFHLTIEEFERMKSPGYGQFVILELDDFKYRLTTPLEKSDEPLRYERVVNIH